VVGIACNGQAGLAGHGNSLCETRSLIGI